jgi:hypothetical protein
MTEPRFAVSTIGDDGFSVKDRKTSQALGYYRTQAGAKIAPWGGWRSGERT